MSPIRKTNVVKCIALAAVFTASTSAAVAQPVVLPSGVSVTVTKQGDGARPAATDVVVVHYRGALPEGAEFDSSFNRGQPASFALNRVIPCWTQALQQMQVGASADLVCPPETAYGARGIPGVIPPNATLHFQVQLLQVQPR